MKKLSERWPEMSTINKLGAEKSTRGQQAPGTHTFKVEASRVEGHYTAINIAYIQKRATGIALCKCKNELPVSIIRIWCSTSHSARAQTQELRALETRKLSPLRESITLVMSTNNMMRTACATIFRDGFAGWMVVLQSMRVMT